MMVADQTSINTTTTKSSISATTPDQQQQQQQEDEETNIKKKIIHHPQHHHEKNNNMNNNKKEEEKVEEEEEVYDDAPMNQGLLSRRRKRIWTRLISQSNINVNDWMRPYWLGFGLFLLLFAFWLLDSLKDPMFAKLTEGNLDKHQPPAKLFSVFCTLLLVCAMEYLANIRNQQQQSIKTHQHVLDPGGNWDRMTIVEQYKSNNNKRLAPDDKVSITIFFHIGITYSIAFIIIAYFLSKFQQQLELQQQVEDISQQSYDNNNNENNENENWNVWYILAYGIYATIESFGSISVATFWSYTNSTLSLSDAEKYYGPIIAIAQIGAIGGSTMVATDHWSSPTLLIVVSLIIVLHVILMWVYHNRFPPTSELLSSSTTTTAVATAAAAGNIVDHKYPTTATTTTTSSGKRRRQQQKSMIGDDNATILTWQDDNVTLTKPFWSGLYLIFKHYYVILILGVSCLYEISLTCLDYQMKLLGLAKYDHDGNGNDDHDDDPNQTTTEGVVNEANHQHHHNSHYNKEDDDNMMTFSQFMGHYGQTVNMISLLFSLILFPILIRRFGLRITLRLFPTLLLGVTIIAYVALPGNLTVLFVSLSLLKAMTYSVHDPSKEILYIPTSNAVKFRAKFWIDIVGERISKAIGSGFNKLAGNVDRSVKLGGIPSLLSSAGLWITCYYAGMEFDRLIKTGEIVGLDQSSMIDPSTYHRVDGGRGGRDVNNDNDDDDDDLSSKPSEVEIEFHNDDSMSAFADVELDIQHDTSPMIPPSKRTPSIIEMTTTTASNTTETRKENNR